MKPPPDISPEVERFISAATTSVADDPDYDLYRRVERRGTPETNRAHITSIREEQRLPRTLEQARRLISEETMRFRESHRLFGEVTVED